MGMNGGRGQVRVPGPGERLQDAGERIQDVGSSTYPPEDVGPSTYPPEDVGPSTYPPEDVRPSTYPGRTEGKGIQKGIGSYWESEAPRRTPYLLHQPPYLLHQPPYGLLTGLGSIQKAGHVPGSPGRSICDST